MNAQSLLRARMATQHIARRGFSTTRPRFDSPFHYPEGPRSNLPFNPKTRFFWLRYWLFMGTGFFIPFGMALWHTYKA
ncbi:cytochrome c oxidase subunit VIIc [Exophiala viscosa]|uniref:Cytochrome c oxidase subunit 8, mitochondrial n=1 Tax=Exophiala viscosa TaxID=2486360 RepID=A0AAN6IGF1_9EURO|nr:cytochrome c oxidase subunit VIIc [Exophiala viscosa]